MLRRTIRFTPGRESAEYGKFPVSLNWCNPIATRCPPTADRNVRASLDPKVTRQTHWRESGLLPKMSAGAWAHASGPQVRASDGLGRLHECRQNGLGNAFALPPSVSGEPTHLRQSMVDYIFFIGGIRSRPGRNEGPWGSQPGGTGACPGVQCLETLAEQQRRARVGDGVYGGRNPKIRLPYASRYPGKHSWFLRHL